MTIWTRNKVQGTRHKEQGTRHKIQELLTTDSNLPVTINPKFEFETRTSSIQHPASNILLRCARNDEPHSVRNDFTGFAIAAFCFPPMADRNDGSLCPQRFHRIGNGRLLLLRRWRIAMTSHSVRNDFTGFAIAALMA